MRGFPRRVIAVFLCLFILLPSAGFNASAASKTGVGMAEWALRAYNEGWKYVFGSEEVGAVDCSGLIRSYINGGGGAKALLDASQASGYMNTMPNVHGLGLWCDGHAGVYVGKDSTGTNMAVDARNSRVNVVYSTMDSRSWNPWVKWFKVQGVTYPTTGWETFNGSQYYYYNGEFVTGIFTVDGVTYDFGKSGALIGKAKPTTATTAAGTQATTAASQSLKPGMRGDEVTAVQQRLRELGYMGAKATGYYGNKTEEAVKKFQQAVGLTPDGIVGPGTKAKLFAADAPKFTTTAKTTTTKPTTATTKPALEQGMSGKEVTAAQGRQRELGYMGAKATGYFGKKTTEALKAFQKAVGLTADGILGEATKEKLFASDAPKMTTTTATTATTTTTAPPTTTTTAVTTAPTTSGTGTGQTESTSAVTTSTPADEISTTVETTTTVPPTPIEQLLSSTTEDFSALYVELEFGTSGQAVTDLQQRLTDLGYYSGNVDGYYGIFLQMAVSQFQLISGMADTGIADPETQGLLYSEYAPASDGTQIFHTEYMGEEYMIDEGDYYEEPEEEAPVPELEDSEGLRKFSSEADASMFARRFGIGGELQTLGISGTPEPTVLIIYNGDSYELTEELQGTIGDCVFF